MLYDAFISYRHAPLDMEIAKKVHTGLETYHVPGAVQKKTGKKKIERVFRDQDELPIGSDLNENIAGALRESEYLVVICSPETPGSYWVAKEIDTFIEMHDRQHVLAVLVAGEPSESFPPRLLTDDNGNPVEPLAADVRGATPSERNKRFKTELLRLLAPILGCSYDDLRQRHRERILKRNILIATIAAGIIGVTGTAFGIYNARVAGRMKKLADEKAVLAEEKAGLADEKTKLADEKTVLADEMKKLAEEKTKLADEILQEYREKQENQSRFYAEEAMMELQRGNREDAVLIASAGLPSATDDRPYVGEAEYALASALHAYDCGRDISFDRLLLHDRYVDTMLLDKDAKYITSLDAGGTVYVWDCGKGQLIQKITSDAEAKNGGKTVSAFAYEGGLTVAYSNAIVRYDATGKETVRIPLEGLKRCEWSDTYDAAFFVLADKLMIATLSTLEVRAEVSFPEDFGVVSEHVFSADGQWFAMAHSATGTEHAEITIVDMKTAKAVTVPATEEYILDMTITDSGVVAAVGTNDDFYYAGIRSLTLDAFAAETGEKLYGKSVPLAEWDAMEFRMLVGAHTVNGKGEIIVVSESNLFSFDETSGESKLHVTLSGSAISLDMHPTAARAYIGCSNGGILVINTDEGKIISGSTVNTGLTLVDVKLLDVGVALISKLSEEIALMRYHTASDLAELPALSDDSIGYAAAPSSAYYVLTNRYKLSTLSFYDKNGEFLASVDTGYAVVATAFYDDTFIIAERDRFVLMNPLTESNREILLKDLGIDTLGGGSFSPDGRFFAGFGFFSGLEVVDLEKGVCIFSDDAIKGVGAVSLSGDGKLLLAACDEAGLCLFNLQTGARTEFTDPAYQKPSGSLHSYLCIAPDGSYGAMACADGCVRVFNVRSGEMQFTIPMQAHSVCFLSFTLDSKHLLTEGDDYRVKIYEASDGTCVSNFDVPAGINYVREDGRFIALCDNYTVSLLDAKSFGRLAYVPYAVTYLSSEQKFVLVNGKKAWTTGYKDYQTLLKEAERQFPGASLSDEKKVLYNIE